MGKHLLAVIIFLLVLFLGYGMWLYSESLRTGKDFNILLKQDLFDKQQTIINWSFKKD